MRIRVIRAIRVLSHLFIEDESKKAGSLTVALGIVERASYTAALIMGFPQWIAVWLAMKVAVGWTTHQTRKGPFDNLYLIGCVISIMFGVIDAWIAMGQLPSSS